MVSLDQAYRIWGGVSLLSDHENNKKNPRTEKLKYYFLPLKPQITQNDGVPQIQVIKYRGSAGDGGFLNFDVNLGIANSEQVTNATIEAIQEYLKQEDRLRYLPDIAPLPLVDGEVKLLLFNAESGSIEEGSTPRFVTKISQAAKPALYGDNQATFSVALDKEGVAILDKALRGEMSPIGICYSLCFHALRRAYSVRVHANWERVQKHFEESSGFDGLFVSTQIDEIVDELIENRVIVVEADTFVPEGEDESGIIGRRDQAINEVKDMITETFFEPSLDPIKEEKDGWDKFQHLAERATAIAVTGGWGAVGTFKYKKIDYTRIDKKVLNVNMTERTTVKRTIYPQGHLSGLIRPLQNAGLNIDDFILSVDADDPWFDERKINVISRANFEQDSIASLNVRMRYNSEPQNVILDADKPRTEEGDVAWASEVADGKMERTVNYDYTVTFKDVDSSERPLELTSPEKVTDYENLEIVPRELYSVVDIPILVLFDDEALWQKYPHIEAHVRYFDEDNEIRIVDSFLLKKGDPEKTWKLFIRDPQKQAFEYKLVYRAGRQQDVETPWLETENEQILIRNPFPKSRTLDIVPNLNWSDEIARCFVDCSYDDRENGISKHAAFEFTEDDRATKTFSVELADPEKRAVIFEVTVLYQDGRMLRIPRLSTESPRLIVHEDMKASKIINVRPDKVNFRRKRLKEMKVELEYKDTDAALFASDSITFTSHLDSAQTFRFNYVDEAKANYQYRVISSYNRSRSSRLPDTIISPWKRVSTDQLVVPVE